MMSGMFFGRDTWVSAHHVRWEKNTAAKQIAWPPTIWRADQNHTVRRTTALECVEVVSQPRLVDVFEYLVRNDQVVSFFWAITKEIRFLKSNWRRISIHLFDIHTEPLLCINEPHQCAEDSTITATEIGDPTKPCVSVSLKDIKDKLRSIVGRALDNRNSYANDLKMVTRVCMTMT
jgi:hypothetical protein